MTPRASSRPGRAARIASIIGIAVAIGACGARSALEGQPQEDGGGAASGSASGGSDASTSTQATATGGGSSSTGASVTCPGLRLVDPVVSASTDGAAFESRIGLLPNDNVLLAWIQSVALFGKEVGVFDAWPPTFSQANLLSPRITSFAFGNGTDGPSAHLTQEDGGATVAYQVWPNLLTFDTSPRFGRSLFVAQVDLVWLFGESDELRLVSTRSVDATAVPTVSEEEPVACSARPLAAAVRVGDTLLSAVADHRGSPVCDAGKSWPETLTTVRYDYVPGAADPLVRGTSESWRSAEPFAGLALTPTSSGAWVVFQTDASTSFLPPPIMAYRIGPDARGVTAQAATEVASSRVGIGVGVLGAVAMGDALAVAYALSDTAGAVRLVVQRVEADGTLGASVEVPADLLLTTQRLDLVASSDASKLLLGWGTGGDRYALARIDCVASP